MTFIICIAGDQIMARRRRRRPPGGHTTAAGSGGRRAPFSTDTATHTHTARSLACPLLTLSSARPFSNGIFRSDGAPLTHTRRMDGFCIQNADQLGSLAGLSFPAVYVGVVDCAPASLSPASSSLTHTRRMDGFCNQHADGTARPSRGAGGKRSSGACVEALAQQPAPNSGILRAARGRCRGHGPLRHWPARLPRRTIFSRCICRCSRMRARLSLPRVLLPHTYTQDGWFLQPERQDYLFPLYM
jgi:hypothetical protein